MASNVIFITEFLIKSISLGFVWDYNSYLRDSWCQLDFFIVIISIMEMVDFNSKFSFIKTVRMLRILRPLKFISHNPNMRVIVNCLLESIKGLFNVFIFIFVIWYTIILILI